MKRFVCTSLAAIMIAGIVMPCAMADDTYIYIRTAADMKDLADKCMLDSYSVGKTVVLSGDIDVSTANFEYIPYFSGTFEGDGYTIKGVKMEVSNPERGFIGTIGENGTVKNLVVEGSITEDKSKEEESAKEKTNQVLKIIDDISGGTKTSVERYFKDSGVYSIGGIAGVNKGTITSCTFKGSVVVNKNVGGIAGTNEGRIEACSNYGEIKSDENTGGIAGKNSGIVRWCSNYGRVNDNAVEGMYATGGICGYSNGVIDSCINYAEVGYKNAGSATGGIVGAQSGTVLECQNQGEVYGKRRVGGIVGNFEPYTNITYNSDEIQDKIQEGKDKVSQDLDSLSNRFDNDRQQILDDMDSFDSKLKNFFGIDDLNNNLSKAADDLNNNISKATDGFNENLGTVSDSLSEFNGTLSDKIEGSNNLETAANSFSSLADTLAKAESDLNANSPELKNLLSTVRDTAQNMSDTTTSLTDSLTTANSDISNVLATLNDNLSDSERRAQITKTIDSVNDAIDSTSDAMTHISELKIPDLNMDLSVLDDTDYQLAKTLKTLNESLGGLLQPFVDMSTIFDDVYKTLADRKAVLEEFKAKLEQWLEELKEKATATETASPAATKLPIVGKSSNPFVTTAYAAEDNNDKTTLKKLLDMDIHDMDIPIKKSICGEENEMAVVEYCINSAPVSGYSDIGGVSGGVGFGIGVGGNFDNINTDGKDFSLNPSTAIKSVISTCINEGEITAKNTSAGGITGFSDLGKTKDCINIGDIKVTDGSYAGGISGYSQTNIMRCINEGDVDAESDIGGIAGLGTDISETYSLTRTKSRGERQGAIAGTIAGEINANYFLKEKLGGINGVDYNNKAEPVSKEILAVDGNISQELSGLESRYWTGTEGDKYMPQLKAFTENNAETIAAVLRAESADAALFRFRCDFIINGQEVKSFNIDYGETIPSDEIPEIPKEDGKFGVWDKSTKDPVLRNTKFTAIYDKSTSTLSYGGQPPQLLVEGDFNPDAMLEINEFEPGMLVSSSKYDPKAGFDVKVTENDEEYKGNMLIHVHMDKKNLNNMKIGLVKENAIVIADSKIDGSYIVFNPDGAEKFVVLRVKPSPIPYMVGGGILLLCLMILFALRKRIRERRLLNALKRFADKTNIAALPAKLLGEEDETENNDTLISSKNESDNDEEQTINNDKEVTEKEEEGREETQEQF